MMMTKLPALLGIMAVAAAIVAIDWPVMRKGGLTKEMWVFSALLLLGVGLSFAKMWRMDLPTPLDGIAIVFRPFSRMLSGLGLLQ